MTNQKDKEIPENEKQEIGANGNEDKEYVQQFNQDKKKTGQQGLQEKVSNASTNGSENEHSPEKGK